MRFIETKFVTELSDVTSNMYRLGWDERNGGNISMIIPSEVLPFLEDTNKVIREIPLGFEADPIVRGKVFLVTGTGKYFKNVIKSPEDNLGLVRITQDGLTAELLWGWRNGGQFTSEFPAHLMSHAERLKVNPKNRVVLHTHPTYTIAMGATVPVESAEFTRKLWKSNTEAIVVFPEGIGCLPCMLCGTVEIGQATAELMKDYRLVSWTNHGIYGCGNDLDEAFGLVETVEKTAQIYMLTVGHNPHGIPDDVLIGLAKLWNLKTKKRVIPGLDDLPQNKD